MHPVTEKAKILVAMDVWLERPSDIKTVDFGGKTGASLARKMVARHREWGLDLIEAVSLAPDITAEHLKTAFSQVNGHRMHWTPMGLWYYEERNHAFECRMAICLVLAKVIYDNFRIRYPLSREADLYRELRLAYGPAIAGRFFRKDSDWSIYNELDQVSEYMAEAA